jgi:hypothetical protein
MTGYYGIPGSLSEKDMTKVHAVDDITENPICGARLRKGMQFQWCGGGFVEHYIECRSGRRILNPIWNANKNRSRR